MGLIKRVWLAKEVRLLGYALIVPFLFLGFSAINRELVRAVWPLFIGMSILIKFGGVGLTFHRASEPALGYAHFAARVVFVQMTLALSFAFDYWMIADSMPNQLTCTLEASGFGQLLYFSLLSQCFYGSDICSVQGNWAMAAHALQVLSSMAVLVYALGLFQQRS
jgi:hypothetical protein